MKTNLTYKTLMILISLLLLPSAYSSAAGYEDGYVHVGATVTFHVPVVSYAYRIRHFYHPTTVINYFYDPVFTDSYWYPYDAYYWDDPFYMGSSFYVGYTGYVGFSFGISWNYPMYFRSRYAWRPPVYHSWRYRPMVYNYRVPYYYSSSHFSNRYYYGNYYTRNTYYNNYYYQNGYRSNTHINNHVNNHVTNHINNHMNPRTNHSRGNTHTRVEVRGHSQVQGQASRRSYGVRNSGNSRRVASGNALQGTVPRHSSSAVVRTGSARQGRTVQTNTRSYGRTVTVDAHRRNTGQRSSGIANRTTTRSNYHATGRSRTQAVHAPAVRSRANKGSHSTGYRSSRTTVKRVNVTKPAVRRSSGHAVTKAHAPRSAGNTSRSAKKNTSRGHRR
ncbi:MAG: hypothetical protein J7K46_05470 [Bacteroidales bacterium]|nr:hypothetical protein [Bacteroidales bacterium]